MPLGIGIGIGLSLQGGAGGEAAPVVIGGQTVGEPGAAGTIYEGYTLSWGDDFNSLNILSPTNSRGRYFTTRTYLAGARGSDTLLGTMYDTDPYMTGHLDSNRGVPVGYDNMGVAGSVLGLRARRATTEEKAHFSAGAVGGRQQVAAMISGPGAVHWYPGPEDTGDIVYEARMRFSAAAGNPAGWHPTMWSQSLNPTIAIDSDEMDWEGNADNIGFGYNRWTSGAGTGTAVGTRVAHDGDWHLITMILSQGKIELYRDGVLHASSAVSANTKSKPQYPLITNHVYSGTFEGDTYSQSEWAADADGALLEVDYCRVWRRTGRDHFRPLVSVADVNVDYGDSVTITLPSKLTLWGDADVTEYLQAVYNEENEPGVTHTTVFSRLPTGVSDNLTTREVTVNIATGKTGRINFVLSAWKTDGATGEPLRFAVNVGPNLSVATVFLISEAAGTYNLDAICDCGVLTTNGTSRTKSVSVSGLPGWATYSDATGLLSYTAPAGAFSVSASVTITNSLGQSTVATLTLENVTVGAFILDTFTTASTTEALLSHTTDSGTTWTMHTGSIATNPPLIHGATDRCYTPAVAANGRQVIYTNANPDDANYVVEADLDMVTTVSGDIIGVVGRCDVSGLTMYYARYSVLAGGVQLYKILSGALTQLGSTYSTTWANGSTNTLSLIMSGTAISVEINGTPVIAVTDGSITAKGKAGIAVYRDTAQTPTTGLQYTEFRALVP